MKKHKNDLEAVIERYSNCLYKICFLILKNEHDTKDVLQETFLAYYRSAPDFAGEEHLRAWLLRTAINKAKNMTRTFWRRNRESLDDYADSLAAAPAEDGALLQAVLALPKRCRMIMHLFYYEGYSVQEIATLLGIRENTVKSQLHRGRTLLKQQLQEGWNDDEP